ncbi:hypothetical protein MASR1M12_35260 [Erysipelotrichia bacterium]
MPEISVVMSVYNSEAWLREAVASILAQTFTDFEFIIINDGSTDGSLDIIESFRDSRIVLVNQENAGLAAALNRGVQLAKASLIARMDADDVSLPERLRIQVDFMRQNPEIIAVGSAAVYMDESGRDIAPVQMPRSHAEILLALPESPFIHPTVVFRKEFFFLAQGYPVEFLCAQDAVLFNRMAGLGKIANLPECLLRYRIHRGAISRRTDAQRQALCAIIARAVASGKTSPEDCAAMAAMRTRVGDKERNYAYHLFLARLYLRSKKHVEARRELLTAFRYMKSYREILPLFTYACLPSELAVWAGKLYRECRKCFY